MKILHIHSSNREEGSKSFELARYLTSEIQTNGVTLEVDNWNIWKESLPEVDDVFMQAKGKIAGNENLSHEEHVLWSRVENAVMRLKQADIIVISVPMWNFGIPYKLKHLIDVVTQYGYLFNVTDEGYEGLLKEKRAVLVLSRGGDYTEGTPAAGMDHQSTYLKVLLGFWGIERIDEITLNGMMADSATQEASRDSAKAKAASIAKELSA